MMDIAVHDQHVFYQPVQLCPPDCHRHIVNYTEALTMVGACMVKATANVEADPVFDRVLCRENGASSRQPESFDQFRRVGDLHLQLLLRSDHAAAQPLDIIATMHQEDVIVFRWLWTDKVLVGCYSVFYQPLVNEPIFLSREDVRTQRQVIPFVVDEVKGKFPVHGLKTIRSVQHAQRKHSAFSTQSRSRVPDRSGELLFPTFSRVPRSKMSMY